MKLPLSPLSVIPMTLLLLLLAGCGSSGTVRVPKPIPVARTSNAYNDYIQTYAHIAIENQKKYKIPASITLAQGLLESGAGQSRLAREGNNHFGIKCHNTWTGGRIYHDDDLRNECFRAYRKAEESFRDHSLFLRRPRYSRLFSLNIHDYKGWARGLQQCGYATDRGYANKLIKIIEDNRLYLIDRGNAERTYTYTEPSRSGATSAQVGSPAERPTFIGNGLLYIRARSGDTLAGIAREMEMSERKLCNFNDYPEGYPLAQGDIVYLQRKHPKALPPYYEHVIKVGESIHSIAQTYGIRLASLYRLNKLTDAYEPKEGDVLRLR